MCIIIYVHCDAGEHKYSLNSVLFLCKKKRNMNRLHFVCYHKIACHGKNDFGRKIAELTAKKKRKKQEQNTPQLMLRTEYAVSL